MRVCVCVCMCVYVCVCVVCVCDFHSITKLQYVLVMRYSMHLSVKVGLSVPLIDMIAGLTHLRMGSDLLTCVYSLICRLHVHNHSHNYTLVLRT